MRTTLLGLLMLFALQTTFCQQEIKICSFNIKFIGSYKKKDNVALASFLEPYDIVLVQELVSPPKPGRFPDGTPYEADKEAKAFVDEMACQGFEYLLSVEDTGSGDKIHLNSSATEWFIAFYKPEAVKVDSSLFNQYLAEDRSNNPDYERVPHAFSFKTLDDGLDFTLISVHLKPGEGIADKSRRKEELEAINKWICLNNELEQDFIIVGDMNIYSKEELESVLSEGYQSLNNQCLSTTMAKESRPYDHVMYSIADTQNEIRDEFIVVDLIQEMKKYWVSQEPYPDYDMNLFYQYFSDHHPVVFTMVSDGADDD